MVASSVRSSACCLLDAGCLWCMLYAWLRESNALFVERCGSGELSARFDNLFPSLIDVLFVHTSLTSCDCTLVAATRNITSKSISTHLEDEQINATALY